MRVLILGGSTEASTLARRIAGDRTIDPVLSLAGRTRNPAAPPIAHRVGGFGGAAGLAAWLRHEAIEIVIDATHPFAERISANAEAACRETAVPLAIFTRPPWVARAGDRWIEVPNVDAAVRAIGERPRRVFVTVGRLALPAFEAAPQHHYFIRTIDPPRPPPQLPDYRVLLARGPFAIADELRLLDAERIDMVVTKNSGGEAARAKLDAAREQKKDVILIRPPAPRDGLVFYDIEAVLAFLHERPHSAAP